MAMIPPIYRSVYINPPSISLSSHNGMKCICRAKISLKKNHSVKAFNLINCCHVIDRGRLQNTKFKE